MDKYSEYDKNSSKLTRFNNACFGKSLFHNVLEQKQEETKSKQEMTVWPSKAEQKLPVARL